MSSKLKKKSNLEKVIIDKVDYKGVHNIFIAKINTKTEDIKDAVFIDSIYADISPYDLVYLCVKYDQDTGINKVYTYREGQVGVRITEFTTIKKGA
jgi:hypothetical protein